MSISSTTRRAGPFTCNGATTAFPFAFKVFQASDVVVTLTDSIGNVSTLALTTNYTLSLNSNQDSNPGGTVTALIAYASGYTITITSAVPATQPTVLTNNGGFYPTVINDALDRVTIVLQQMAEVNARQLTFPVSEPASTSATLPSASGRASKYLGFDSSGNLAALVGTSASDIAAYGQILAGGNYTGKIVTLASSASKAGLNVPAGIAPTTPVAGDFWNVSGALFFYTGSINRQLATLDGTETLANKTISGGTISAASITADNTVTTTGTIGANSPGFRGLPVAGGAPKTASYTLALTDAGFDVQMNATTLTVTIPANASVAFPIGTSIMVSNLFAGNLTLAITTDSLFIAGTTTGGAATSRTIAQNGQVILTKKTATVWWVSGPGLS